MSNSVGRVPKKPSVGGWEGTEEQAENRAILTATASHRLDLRIQQSGRLTRADHATSGGVGCVRIRVSYHRGGGGERDPINSGFFGWGGDGGRTGAGGGVEPALTARTTARGNRVKNLREARWRWARTPADHGFT